ncbi:MAG: GAF domain-containing protein [Chloroflexota bacterium]|nr:MAG: GAF domain-containing protein [Chloroflexota bacterium]
MSFFQQLIEYLSRPPDSIVYHIVTLLALQATLGLAWWQARRRPDDAFTRRLAWASGAILLLRLIVLLAVFATANLVEASMLLPPLEAAVDALTVAVLVWALAPQPRTLPYLGSALLLVIVIIIVFIYVSFALEWQELVESGTAASNYSGTEQAAVWNLLQMVLLVLGGVAILITREEQWSLRLAILAVLFVAHTLSLWYGDTLTPQKVEVSYWTRLGYIIAFPMLAVLAYRHNLQHLLPSSHLGRPVVEQLERSLNLSRKVSASLDTDQTMIDALTMARDLFPAQFLAIALVDRDRTQHLQVAAIFDNPETSAAREVLATRKWAMKRDDWPSFALALRQREQVELVPDGPGARQLHELMRELDLDEPGALLIEPLYLDSAEIGLLMLLYGQHATSWPDDQKRLCHALGQYLAQAFHNADRYRASMVGEAPKIEEEKADLLKELNVLSKERNQALSRQEELSKQLEAKSDLLVAERRKSREATGALAVAAQRHAKSLRLQKEIVALREALSEAELALASAAAGDAGLSAEWVMRTVTRYSGELEQAHDQIDALEAQLQETHSSEGLEEIAAGVRGLRTPLTSISGYTDLLLNSNMGSISIQQENSLQRMQANVESMIKTVDLMNASTRRLLTSQTSKGLVQVRGVIEAALNSVGPVLQAKALRIDLSIADDLPSLLHSGDGFHRIVVQALTGACLVSSTNGRLRISAQQLTSNGKDREPANGRRFLRLVIGDEAGRRSHDLYSQAIGDQRSRPSSQDGVDLSELSATVENTASLATAHGGRSWLDFTSKNGSAMTVLLPLSDPSAAEN